MGELVKRTSLKRWVMELSTFCQRTGQDETRVPKH